MSTNISILWPFFRDLLSSARNRCIGDMASAFLRDEEGATMVEYALMVVLIALVCISAVQLIGTNLNDVFSDLALLI